MQNKWRKYGGITVISLLITYIIFMQFNYQRLLKRSEQESQARQEMEWLLKSRERQVQFYFDKVNELIAANQKLAMTNGSLDRIETLKLDDQLVWQALDSKEYKEIMTKYEEHYGILDKIFIPENETLNGLKYKVEESIAAGDDLLPRYYGITNVLLWVDTKEFKALNSTFREHFGDVIPTEQIGGTMEQLIEIVNKSVQEGENLLPEYYGYGSNRDAYY